MGRSRELSELASAYDGSSLGFRNRIINGDMRIDQRNSGASVTPSVLYSTYTLDRWITSYSVASKFSVQQSTTAPAGFVNSALITSLSAYTVGSGENYNFGQIIEGLNMADFGWGTASAQAVTLSFWVRSSLTGTFGGAVQNSASNRSYPFSYTISSANTWEQKTITISGDTTGTWLTTNGVGARIYFGLGAGSTASGTAGAWAAANYFSATGATSVVGTSGATFYITGVQLEAGSVATPFERRPYGLELQLCQRYYTCTVPGSGIRITTYADAVVSDGQVYCPFKVSMRADPTVVVTGSGTTLTNTGGLTTYLINRDGFSFNVSSTSGAGMRGYTSCTFTATAEL